VEKRFILRHASFLFALIIILLGLKSSQAQFTSDSSRIAGFFSESLKNGQAYSSLHYLCKRIGSRLSGSPQAAAAVVYCQQLMQQYGFDSVWLQPCMVPHWVRGNAETAMAFVPGGEQRHLRVCALGGSVGTPSDGLSGQIVIVSSMEELEKLGTKGVKGKIVFFNRPMDPEKINTFMAYGGAVDQRGRGPSKAAKFGAIGTICRSMTNEIDGFPHTGSMSYNDSFPKIPCIAISTSDAEWLSKKVMQNSQVTVSFTLSCQTLPDVESFNVIGEIRGSEKPEEIIVVGGHLDSWDTGEGAHDDGAGCMQSIEALRAIRN
jgi:hypothetical protein